MSKQKMRTMYLRNAALRNPLAYGGTERDPLDEPLHATVHRQKNEPSMFVVALRKGEAYELDGDTRVRVGPIEAAADAAYCTEDLSIHAERGHPSHSDDERPALYVATGASVAYCQTCARCRQAAYQERKKAGTSGRTEAAERSAKKRDERVAAMTRRHQEARERSAREHFAVVARNLLFGVASGVEVNPDGSLTSTTGFPAVGQNTPMRGPLAQRRMFALAQFTAACTDHGYTVEQAAGFLGVEVEQVSWKQYRTAYPRKRQDDEQEEAA